MVLDFLLCMLIFCAHFIMIIITCIIIEIIKDTKQRTNMFEQAHLTLLFAEMLTREGYSLAGAFTTHRHKV